MSRPPRPKSNQFTPPITTPEKEPKHIDDQLGNNPTLEDVYYEVSEEENGNEENGEGNGHDVLDTDDNAKDDVDSDISDGVPQSGISNEFVIQAQNATKTIEEDVKETMHILKNHGANTTELLHLIEHWLTEIYYEFKGQHEKIKLIMQKKWLEGELKGDRADVGTRKKNLLRSIVSLETWKKDNLNNSINHISQTYKSDQGTLVVESDRLKEELNLFLDEIIRINGAINEIVLYHSSQHFDDKKAGQVALQQQIDETLRYVSTLKELNKKDIFTIVVLGLEKAGKTTFINALLRDDILPTDPQRCTQVVTVIKKSNNPNTVALVEFYTQPEYLENIKQRAKDVSEKQIKEACETYVGSPELRLDVGILGEEKFSTKTKDFIANPHLMYVVKRVTIYTSRFPSEVNFEIIDAPGFDSPLKEHKLAVSKAISEADAFVLLMSGQRPSLTEPQIQVLDEILGKHYDAMSKAFAGITWLDEKHTAQKYNEHLNICKAELQRFHFREDNIYPICSKIKLLARDRDKHEQELQEILQKADIFEGLKEGFEDLEYALQYSVKNELPVKRAHQAIDLAQRKLLPMVNTGIALGRQIIPDFITEDNKLDREIESGNVQQWSDIFLTKRLKPTVDAALRWKKSSFVFEKAKQSQLLLQQFQQQFDVAIAGANIKVNPLDNLMLSDEDLIAGFELSHRHVEDKERNFLVERFEQVIDVVSQHLAHFIYTTYITKFVELLNAVCTEEPSMFSTEKRVEHCNFEILALLKRVAIPLIRGTLRWAHDNKLPRKAAALELTRVVPWVALQVCDKTKDTPNLTQLVSNVLGFTARVFASKSGFDSLPEDIKKLLKILFPGETY